jgi:hypothetical protein
MHGDVTTQPLTASLDVQDERWHGRRMPSVRCRTAAACSTLRQRRHLWLHTPRPGTADQVCASAQKRRERSGPLRP